VPEPAVIYHGILLERGESRLASEGLGTAAPPVSSPHETLKSIYRYGGCVSDREPFWY